MTKNQRNIILIIEDDDAVRNTLSEILEFNGFPTVTANNGFEGLRVARSAGPSLIITDIAMPVMDGFALLEAVRADPGLRAIPVIVVSAKVERAATRRGMELGADDFITKPFSEGEVIHSVATRLEKKELIDELDAFAHTVAHDLSNPLLIINGRLDLLATMVGNSADAALLKQVEEASTSARRLKNILEELLVLSGVRSQTVTPRPLDMGVIVGESIESLANIINAQSARVTRPEAWPAALAWPNSSLSSSASGVTRPEAWPAALGHGPWVVEVWVNYISNALKYGGPSPQIILGGERSADGASARFWVEDSGPGLDEAAQERMFVPFTRITTVRANGHGLGLSIVRRIIEKLHGRVGVESRPGAGARFWFELPTSAGNVKL